MRLRLRSSMGGWHSGKVLLVSIGSWPCSFTDDIVFMYPTMYT